MPAITSQKAFNRAKAARKEHTRTLIALEEKRKAFLADHEVKETFVREQIAELDDAIRDYETRAEEPIQETLRVVAGGEAS